MAKFIPNPNVESTGSFDVVKPGTYTMTVKDISQFRSSKGNECLKVRLAFADPTACVKIDGTPCQSPGNIFDNGLVLEPAEKQGKLKSFAEACGETWVEFNDTDTLLGKELQVNIGVKEYEGVQKNTVKRYLK